MSLFGMSWLEALTATLAIGTYATLCVIAVDRICRHGEREVMTLLRLPRPGTNRPECATTVGAEDEARLTALAS